VTKKHLERAAWSTKHTAQKTTIMMTLFLLLLLYLWFLLCLLKVQFLGEFAKNCEKQLLSSSCLSVRPSVCLFVWNNLAATGRTFMKLDIGVFFEKLSKKFQVFIKISQG